MESLNPETLSSRETYDLLTGLIVPRPIALVTTRSREGVLNCAPFSFYQGVCGDPPILSLSIARQRSGLKDTFRNVLLEGEFVVHTPREEDLEAVEVAAGSFDPEASEVEAAGFTPVESEEVRVQGLAQLPVRMECRLHDQFSIAGGRVTLIFGRVVRFHLDEELRDEEGRLDYERLRPLARLGAGAYTTLGELRRPSRRPEHEETYFRD